jgi:hypothetical protein
VRAFRRWRKKDHEFETSLGFIGDPVSKREKKKKRKENGIRRQDGTQKKSEKDSSTCGGERGS